MRRAAIVAVLFSLVSGLAWTAVWARGDLAPPAEDAFVGRIGDERSAASLGGLTVAPDLVDVARRHAQEMADQQRLYHNDRLATDVANWQKVGENVGRGPSVEEIHQAFMASSSHRDNILEPSFTEVGVGVVADGPDLWVVEVFRLPKSAPAAAPAPAPSGGSSEPPSAPPTTAAPQPRPGAGGDGGGTVRAAGAAASAPRRDAAADAPAPSTTTPEVPTTAQAPVPPTTAPVAAPVTPFDTAERARPSAPSSTVATSPPPRASARVAAVTVPRDVTLPIGLAAGMLVLVVGGLAWQVASDRARSASGKRASSVVDVWELALAA